MGLSSSMNVRLPQALKDRLEKVASVSRLKSSDLFRMAVEQYVDHVEKTGSITIPFTLQETDAEPGEAHEPKPVKYAPKKRGKPKA